MKWSARGMKRRRVLRKTEAERERDGRGTKKLEMREGLERGQGEKKKRKGGRVHVFCWKSVLWLRLIANKCLNIVE